MPVRAKFYVSSINVAVQPGSDPYSEVTLKPVYGSQGGSDDNATWSKWTPDGEIKMTLTNPDALDSFNLGESYFIDFTPVSLD